MLGYTLTLSSYYVFGFQELAAATGLSLDLTSAHRERGFEEFRARVGPEYIPTILLLRYSRGPKAVFAALDLADSANPAFQYSYRRDVLPHVDAYFKVNLDRAALRRDEWLRQFDSRVFDLPFFFAVRPRFAPDLLRAPSEGQSIAWAALKAVETLRSLWSLLPPSALNELGAQPARRDYALLVTYYPHADHRQDNEFRLELIRRLREDPSLNGIAAFAAHTAMPAPFSNYAVDFLPLRKLLDLYATSKVAVYVRGLHDCLSFKLGQYLALGMPIAGQTITLDNRFAREIPSFATQFSGTTPDEIVRAVKAALASPEPARSAMGQANRDYFNERVSPMRAAQYVLDTLRSLAPAVASSIDVH